MRPLRAAFLGNDPWSVPSLEALAGSTHPVVAVLTAVPKPAGRGNRLTPTAVATAAKGLGLPVLEVETVRSGRGLDALAASAPDVLAVVAYGELLPPSVLELPTVAPVNLHFSLLPELRGASPVQTALLRGMPETGVSTMVMAEGLDTGPVLLQARAPIGPDDDAGSLGARLAELGARLLVETIDGLAAGTLDPKDQDETRATLAPRLRAGDRVLDWRDPAAALVNLTRALAPEPAATTAFRDEPLKVVRAEAGAGEGEPGTVVAVSKDGFGVATGADVFFPLELAPAGRRRMSAAEFVRGHRPRIGERLG